jgi:hypothetical protein
MPNGFGSQPFGSTPYGLGSPATAPARGGALLRDATTGQSRGSRKINPSTRDYELDEYGRLLGMSDVHQLVLLAVSTTKGSAAMRTLGHELRKIERISANFIRRVESALTTAVQHLVDAGLVEVVDVEVELVRPSVARARLRWRDLTTGLDEETEV